MVQTGCNCNLSKYCDPLMLTYYCRAGQGLGGGHQRSGARGVDILHHDSVPGAGDRHVVPLHPDVRVQVLHQAQGHIIPHRHVLRGLPHRRSGHDVLRGVARSGCRQRGYAHQLRMLHTGRLW